MTNLLRKGEGGELTLLVIQLLMAYFDERTEGLILLADMSATAVDVELTLTLSASPRLILLVAVFASYYVFNLQYQEDAGKTLEFVLHWSQPGKGDKGQPGEGGVQKDREAGPEEGSSCQSTCGHPHKKNLLDFEWGFT
ncbi:hypothetical protein VZT92_026686 [Zoarces viviparus]|uniref:Uncharacterized protein n=1 Tax=Zoarces viviparus TaxID=48416 RepID=A0AAW1DW88_ZOAVI